MRLPLSHKGFGLATKLRVKDSKLDITVDPRGMIPMDFALGISATTLSVKLDPKQPPSSLAEQRAQTIDRLNALTPKQLAAIDSLRAAVAQYSWHLHIDWSQLILQLDIKSSGESEDHAPAVLAAITLVAEAFVANDSSELTRLMRAALVERDPERRAADQRCVIEHHLGDPRGLKLVLDATDDAKPLVRARAAEALARHAAHRDIAAFVMREIAENKTVDLQLRAEALETWLTLDTLSSVPELMRSFENFIYVEDGKLASIVLNKLAQHGEQIEHFEDMLLLALNASGRVVIHEHLLAVLESVGTPKALPAALRIARAGVLDSPLRAQARMTVEAIRQRQPRDAAGAVSVLGESGNVSLSEDS